MAKSAVEHVKIGQELAGDDGGLALCNIERAFLCWHRLGLGAEAFA